MDKLTTLPGFRWMPGMRITHVGQPMIVLSVQTDEWLGEPFYVLITYNPVLHAPLCTVIVREETFLDLSDPATGGCLEHLLGFTSEWVQHKNETLAEACARAALELGKWPGGLNAGKEQA